MDSQEDLKCSQPDNVLSPTPKKVSQFMSPISAHTPSLNTPRKPVVHPSTLSYDEELSNPIDISSLNNDFDPEDTVEHQSTTNVRLAKAPAVSSSSDYLRSLLDATERSLAATRERINRRDGHAPSDTPSSVTIEEQDHVQQSASKPTTPASSPRANRTRRSRPPVTPTPASAPSHTDATSNDVPSATAAPATTSSPVNGTASASQPALSSLSAPMALLTGFQRPDLRLRRLDNGGTSTKRHRLDLH
jgi:hypothetical protein